MSKRIKFVDVSRIDEMRGIEEKANSIYVGAATTHSEILESHLLRKSIDSL